MQSIELIIIESIKKGEDHKALSYLYEKPLRNIRKYILKNGGNNDEANDIFQDSVIALFQKIKQGTFDSNYPLDGFLFIVAKNLWINKAIKKKRIKNIEYNENHNEYSDNEDQLKNLITREKSLAMRMAFEKLKPQCQKLLSFVIYDKLSMKEICQKMGFSNENVAKTQHYRCKQYLAKIINENTDILNMLRN